MFMKKFKSSTKPVQNNISDLFTSYMKPNNTQKINYKWEYNTKMHNWNVLNDCQKALTYIENTNIVNI